MLRQGGSYQIDPKTGEPKLIERTQDHPDGNAPRDAHGNLIVDGRPAATTQIKSPASKTKE